MNIMKIFHSYGRVSSVKRVEFILGVFLVGSLPSFLIAQYKDEYPKEAINAQLKVRLRLLIQPSNQSGNSKFNKKGDKKVYRPVVKLQETAVSAAPSGQTESLAVFDGYVGTLPLNWHQLFALLKQGVTTHGVEIPRIISIFGPANAGKTFLIKKLAEELQVNYVHFNLALIVNYSNPLTILDQDCMEALNHFSNQKLILHLEKFNELCESVSPKLHMTIAAILERFLADERCKAIIAVESSKPIVPSVFQQLKSLVELVEVKPLDTVHKKALWKCYLERVQLPTVDSEQLANRFKHLNAQDIYTITQRIALRCLVVPGRTPVPFSLDLLIQEINNYTQHVWQSSELSCYS